MLLYPPRRKVKVTPSFIIFRNGEKVHQHGGINETNLHRVRGGAAAAAVVDLVGACDVC